MAPFARNSPFPSRTKGSGLDAFNMVPRGDHEPVSCDQTRAVHSVKLGLQCRPHGVSYASHEHLLKYDRVVERLLFVQKRTQSAMESPPIDEGHASNVTRENTTRGASCGGIKGHARGSR